MTKTRVLVVDDSAFMRTVISDIINRSEDLMVIATARDGLDALAKIHHLDPDVVTLDIEMPQLDGLSALERIMKEHPVPVVMLSSLTQSGAEQTLKALQLGAVDFIAKPGGKLSPDMTKIKQDILEKIRIAAGAKKKLQNLISSSITDTRITSTGTTGPKIVPRGGKLNNLVLIGTSTGGPKALYQVIPRFPASINAGILVVQHMPPGFTKSLAERLDTLSEIRVKEAEHGEKILPGTAYIAPGDFHMKVCAQSIGGAKELTINLDKSPPRGALRPAADVLLESVAQEYWSHMVCVIMTGMGHDGAAALPALKQKGAQIIAEDQSTCIVYGMPKAAVETGLVDRVVPLPEIHREVMKML